MADNRTLSGEEVLKIAKLARLAVEEDETGSLTRDFNAILSYIQKLEKIDISEVTPMSHVHGIKNVMRADEVTPGLDSAEALQGAPDRHGDFIRVPIIIE